MIQSALIQCRGLLGAGRLILSGSRGLTEARLLQLRNQPNGLLAAGRRNALNESALGEEEQQDGGQGEER